MELIDRKAAIDAINTYIGNFDAIDANFLDGLKTAKTLMMQLPSAQPQQKWIPIKTRPMDEDEREYWSDFYGCDIEKEDAVTFDCPMPNDGQEVWVCSRKGNVWVDVCVIDDGTGLEGNGDWLDIVAWMPYEKPEPWKGDSDETD